MTKRTENSTINHRWEYILTSLCVLLMIFIVARYLTGNLTQKTSGSLTPLTDGWYYLNENQRIPVMPGGSVQMAASELILYHDTLSSDANGMTLYMKNGRYTPTVRFDEATLYQYDDQGIARSRHMQSQMGITCQLPFNADGGVLSISLKGDGSGVYTVSPVYVASGDMVLARQFKTYAYTTALAVVMLMLGLLAVVGYLGLLVRRTRTDGILAIGFYLILSGIWCLTDSTVIDLVIDNAALTSFMAFYSFMLMPVALLSFIRGMDGYGRNKSLKIVTVGHYLNVIVQSLLFYGAGIQPAKMLIVSQILVLISGLVVSLVWIRERQKNKSAENTLLGIGIVGLLASAVIAFVLYWFMHYEHYVAVFETGLVIFIIAVFIMVAEGAVANERFKVETEVYARLALEDMLTGLKNRRSFDEYLELIPKMDPPLQDAALLFLDVEHLKTVNDQYGHHAGDELLVAACRAMEKAFGRDNCYRIGGNEYCIVLENPTGTFVDWMAAWQSEADAYNANHAIQLSAVLGYSMLRDENGLVKTQSNWKMEADQNMQMNKTQDGIYRK